MIKNYGPYILSILTVCLVFSFSVMSTKVTSSGLHGKLLQKVAPPFSLRTTSNKKFTQDDLKGKWTYLTFGFTKCNGVCPLNLSKLALFIDKLDETKDPIIKRAQFLFVSIDEKRDNDKNLNSFTKSFSSKILPLKAGSDTGREVSLSFNSYIRNPSNTTEEDYQINHAGFLYLINPLGNIQVIYTNKEVSALDIKEDLKSLWSKYGTSHWETRLSSK